MHNVLPNSGAYAEALLRECKKRGVVIHTSMRVEELLRNADGEIIGARANGREYFGRRGVILATGDYSASAEMKAKYVGEDAAKIPPVNPNNTGDGFKLGADAGGVMIQMDRLYEGLRFAPSTRVDPIKMLPSHPLISKAMRLVVERLPRKILAYVVRGALTSWVGPNNTMYRAGAILVGHRGKRIANEDSDKAMARAAAADAKNTAYMIFDERVARKFSAWPNPVSTFPGVAYAYVDDYKRYRPDVYHRAETIEELAAEHRPRPGGADRERFGLECQGGGRQGRRLRPPAPRRGRERRPVLRAGADERLHHPGRRRSGRRHRPPGDHSRG